jgi:hypothetical protein
LIFPCLNETIASYTKPIGGVREALQFIAAHQQRRDLVICDSYSSPTILYYRLLQRPYTKSLNFGIEIENQIEGKFNGSEFDNVCNSLPANHRLWTVTETIFYQRTTKRSACFKERILALVKNYQLKNPDWILSLKLIQNLKANRHLVTQYLTDRVEVYAFDCK